LDKEKQGHTTTNNIYQKPQIDRLLIEEVVNHARKTINNDDIKYFNDYHEQNEGLKFFQQKFYFPDVEN
jgi:hypothetical protein